MTPRRRSVICGLGEERKKNTSIGATAEKQIRVTHEVSVVLQGEFPGTWCPLRLHQVNLQSMSGKSLISKD